MKQLYALCITHNGRVSDTVHNSAGTAQFVFETLYRNIRKVVPKYVTCFCFFYMNIAVCHKEYWKIIWDIRFYNSCFKFGCGNIADENMMHICCSFLSSACQFVNDWHHAIAKDDINKISYYDINKISYFIIFFDIRQVSIAITSHYYLLL